MTRLFENPLLNQVDQAEDLLRGRLPPVDDEIPMFFGDLGVADPDPLEPGLFDEPAGGEIPRVLEDGTGIPEFQRVFFPSEPDDFPDPSGDLFFLPPPRRNAAPMIIVSAGKSRFLYAKEKSRAAARILAPEIEEAHRINDILDLPPVGPGVHPDGAAHAAGDAGAELHPRERFAHRQAHQLGKGEPASASRRTPPSPSSRRLRPCRPVSEMRTPR